MPEVYHQPSLFVCEIPLTRGLVALVDADLFPALSQRKWHAGKNGYAAGCLGGGSKEERRRIYMHHAVLRLRGVAVPPKHDVDHINRNKLDNRTENLRVVRHWLNGHNGSMHHDNASGYRGVCRDKRHGGWVAQLTVRGIYHNLGRYPTPEAASAAYEEARRALGLTPQ